MSTHKINRQNLADVLAAILFTSSGGVIANPEDEFVIARQAGFIRNRSELTITQGPQRVIINCQDFSTGNGELSKFIQPNNGSVALNRVVFDNLSSFLGDLEANDINTALLSGP